MTTIIDMNDIIQSDDILDTDQAGRWQPDVLVLGPGGIKGFLELGALYRFKQTSLLNNVHTFVGVSVGSIISSLYMCGFNVTEMYHAGFGIDLFSSLNFSQIKDMVDGKGLLSHDILRQQLTDIITKKRGNVPTFLQLYNETHKNLIIVTYNLTRKTTYYISRFTHPDMSIVEAMLASSSIPGIFYQFIYRGEIYIDGAFGNPYPVDMVDDGKNQVLGMYIHGGDYVDPSNLTKNLSSIIHAPITELRSRIIKYSSHRCKHIKLYSDVTGMHVDEDGKMEMFRSGHQTADDFLSTIGGYR